MLSSVYGVRLHPAFTRWLDVLDVISLDIVGLSYPSSCLGSMIDRLLINAFWPFALVLVGSIFISAHVVIEAGGAGVSLPAARRRSALLRMMLDRSIYFFILVFYLALPNVARSLFKARQCESFPWRDEPTERISFLQADFKITCNTGTSWSADVFDQLAPFFWSSYVI
jgi:hypothetical protein